MIALIHIEKTGGITLNYILRNSFGKKHCDVQPVDNQKNKFEQSDLNFIKKTHPGLESIAAHRIKPFIDFEDNLQFYTFLRDPIARTISHYQYQIQKMNSTTPFEEWVKKRYYHNFQTKKLAGEDNADKAIEMIEKKKIFIGLNEKFQESLELFNAFLDYPLDLTYSSKNVAPDNSIKKQIMSNPEFMETLNEMNQNDLKLYNYVVQELYPKQKEAIMYDASKTSEKNNYNQYIKHRKYSFMPRLKLKRIFG